jgi:branched-chain amino acid transport system substrate-binding protein
MSKLIKGLAVAALVSAAVVPAARAETLKIGIVSAKSGPFAIWGTSGEDGAILAADEINASGGILGRKIELVLADSKSKPQEASRIFREMVADGTQVVVGTIASGETQAVSTLAREEKVPFFTTLGYTRFLTEEEGHRYFFRLISNSHAYYGPMVDRLLKIGYTRYCTINNDYAFGRSLNADVMGEIKQKNPKVEVIDGCEFWVPLGSTDFTTYLTAILSKHPEIVMFGGVVGPSVRAFVAQATQFGLFKAMVGAHPALGWPANNIGLREEDIPPRTIITGSDYPYPPVKSSLNLRFLDAYTKRWHEVPMSEGAHAFTAIYFIKQAFEKAGKIDREAFVDAAEGLGYEDPALGELNLRPFDHQSNAGAWVGYLGWSKEYQRPGMDDISYVPGEEYLPTKEDVDKLRRKK